MKQTAGDNCAIIVDMLKKLIGTKDFYKRVFAIATPIIIQNVITSLVNLLDNIMVGQVGTEAMSGVAIISQLIFVFNLGIFGYTSGVGILGSQYVGKKDDKGFSDTFKIKLGIGAVYIALAFAIFIIFRDRLIMSYLHESDAGVDIAATFAYAQEYLSTMLWGLPFFMLTQIYSSTLREMRQTKIPMLSGIAAVFINLVFNYILIYGHFGFPKLGIVGAAIATNISRIIECGICVVWAHTHSKEAVFAKQLIGGGRVEAALIKKTLIIALPSLANELFWAGGQTILNQSLSLRGVEVVSAINIQSTVQYLFKSAFLALGATIAILIGNALGAKDEELAIDTDNKMIALAFVVTACLASIVFIIAPIVPNLYNTIPEVKTIATLLIRLSAIAMPFDALVNAFYNTIKAGGNPLINFLYDGGYTWIVMVPLAYCIGHFTAIPIGPMYALIYYISNGIKVVIGFILVKKRIWVRNLVK